MTEKRDLEAVNELIELVFVEELGLPDPVDGEEFVLSALVFAETGTGPNEENARRDFSSAIPVGGGRILFDGPRVSLAEIAVLPAYRGQGYGEFLLRLLVDKAVTAGAGEIRLDALSGTEGFFKKAGFVTEGEAFAGNGGQWQPMCLAAEQIPHCEGCCRT